MLKSRNELIDKRLKKRLSYGLNAVEKTQKNRGDEYFFCQIYFYLYLCKLNRSVKMGQIDDRKVHLSGLKSGIYTYSMQLDDAFFEGFKNEEIKGGNVNFDVKMEKNERVTMLTFAFKGEVKTECDRCLGTMTVPVSGEETLNIRFSDTETSDDEDTVILPEGTAELDLTPWLYEYVAVRIPLQHSHTEGECDPEMLSYLAEGEEKRDDDYVDPRWEALKNLK